MNQKKNELLENHMAVIDQIKDVHLDDFFYTRLKSRLENEKHQYQVDLPIKPIFILSCLVFMLILNIIFLDRETYSKTKVNNDNGIEQIISMYDQNISSLY